MCGINGLVTREKVDIKELNKAAMLMNNALKHRGPDSNGIWTDPDQNIVISHTRLSILDLSQAGNQPMISKSKRFVITFNGEIYNHLELRKKIEKINKNISWNGFSDTETLLELIDNLGLKNTLKIIRGMFSIGLWDRINKELYLARDRFGEKPLYYGWTEDKFIFSSELKAFKNFRDSSNSINKKALDLFMRLNYVPAPLSIFKNIYKLQPGSFLKINFGKYPNMLNEHEVEKNQSNHYITFDKWADMIDYDVDSEKYSESSAIISVHTLLRNSVKNQMISDVPLGAFLSGGIDSSLVSAIMQEYSDKPVNTYTIGFNEKKFDESNYARKVANYLGTNHNEEIISAKTAQSLIPDLPRIYDEPFADSSQIPTILISIFAKKDITVALTGDGADELFGGYNRYTQGAKIWKKIFNLPFFTRKLIGNSIDSFPENFWDKSGAFLNRFSFGSKNYVHFANKMRKASFMLKEMSNIDELIMNPNCDWSAKTNILTSYSPTINYFEMYYKKIPKNFELEQKMMLLDIFTYLTDDILCKVDRASMSFGLETRAPFLDKDLASYAIKMPLNYKIVKGHGKMPLREILKLYLPIELIDRPKIGFGIPLSDWLRGPLREWAEELINKCITEKENLFNVEEISKIWHEHTSNKYDHSSKLWSLLSFLMWKNEYEK